MTRNPTQSCRRCRPWSDVAAPLNRREFLRRTGAGFGTLALAALLNDQRLLASPASQVAAAVNPATVHFRSLTDPSRLSVLEQNYQYDLLDPQRLLRKYIGRDVTLVRTKQENGTTVAEEVQGLDLVDHGVSATTDDLASAPSPA